MNLHVNCTLLFSEMYDDIFYKIIQFSNIAYLIFLVMIRAVVISFVWLEYLSMTMSTYTFHFVFIDSTSRICTTKNLNYPSAEKIEGGSFTCEMTRSLYICANLQIVKRTMCHILLEIIPAKNVVYASLFSVASSTNMV